MKTVSQVSKFFSHNPTLLATFGGYSLYEHPTRGDTAPIYMTTPNGALINTGFYDLGDFEYDGVELCMELDTGLSDSFDSAKEAAQERYRYHEENDTLDLY